ncbi:hypothetical protein [Rhodocytophaga rosea]|uniref:hypothetical protein n=1 Tax=Rhodocytophaga rosea TaxID=2704465 RepID=UPI00374362E0
MRGRLANGDWITPFNPQFPYYEYMSGKPMPAGLILCPHDMPGLIELYGELPVSNQN